MKKINSLLEIADKTKLYLFDMFGVIWTGTELFDGVIPLFERLKEQEKKVFILSNATATGKNIEEKLKAHGFFKNIHYDKAITSGDFFTERVNNGFLEEVAGKKKYKFFCLGEFMPILEPVKSHWVADMESADFVYISSLNNGFIFARSVQEFNTALKKLIKLGKPMICANPDYFAFMGAEKYLTQGSIAMAYAKMGGKVYFIGKPYPEIYNYALNLAKVSASDAVMVGDTVRTDIAGAVAAGMRSTLITGQGVTADFLMGGYSVEQLIRLEETEPSYLLERIG